MKKIFLPLLVLGLLSSLPCERKAEANDGKSATLYRDEFGIPHVFAPRWKGQLTRWAMLRPKTVWKSC